MYAISAILFGGCSSQSQSPPAAQSQSPPAAQSQSPPDSKFTNLSASSFPRSPSNLYRVEIIWTTPGRSVKSESVEPVVRIGADSYPMMRTKLVLNRWETLIPVPPGSNNIKYRVSVKWKDNNGGVLQSHIQTSDEFQLRIGNWPTHLEGDLNKAKAGNANAQFNLALKHDMAGEMASAAEWYRKAADSGLKQAQFNYALMLEKGNVIKKDAAMAAEYYERAAKQGLMEARYNLALMLAEGRGVLEDDQAAAAWMKRAADQGYPDAQFHMGYLHRVGEGVPKDDAEAVKWFLRAAENLNLDAQYYTGLCYAHGIGLEQDLVQAYKWLNLAAAANHTRAQRDKEILTNQMTPEAVAEGQRLSVEFKDEQ